MRLSRTAAFVALWRQLRAARREGPGLGVRLRALPRMTVASMRRQRRYDGLRRLALMSIALVYVISPVDFLPVVLLGPVGLIDDAVVITWLAGALLAETGRFLEWERQQSAAAVAPPARGEGTVARDA